MGVLDPVPATSGGGFVHRYPEFGGQPGQSARPTLADRTEAPLAVAAVELAEHHRLDVLDAVDGELGDRAVGGVHGQGEVGELVEGGVVEGRADDDACHIGFGAGQRNAQPRGAGGGLLVEGDRLGGVAGRVEEDEIPVTADQARFGDQQGVRVYGMCRPP